MKQLILALSVLVACDSTTSLPTGSSSVVAPICTKHFRYPHGTLDELRDAKPPGVRLPHPLYSLGSQGTTCGASIDHQWDGINSTNSSCSCNPPDGSIAVSASYVVSVVNTALEVWNKSGTVLSGPTNLQTMMAPAGDTLTGFSDPGVLYDATADRWVVYLVNYNSAETQSTLNVAVSTSNDPTSTWTLYTFTMPYLLDYPHGAINAPSGSDEVLYMSGNLYNGPATFVNAYVAALDLTSMYGGTTPTPVTHNVGNNASGVLADTLIPAQNDTASGVMYFLSADNTFNNSKISEFRWADPFGTNSFGLQGGVTVTSYRQPPDLLEDLAGSVAFATTGDARDLATTYYSGSLYGAHSVGSTSSTAAVQWYQIGSIDSTPTLTQQGTNATADAYRWMPDLAVDGSGDVVISYSYSNGGLIGTRFSARYAGTSSGALLGESDIIDGVSHVDTSRWGDFGTMMFDGTDFWTVGEYENDTSTGGWATYIAAISLGTSAAFDIALAPSYQDAIRGSGAHYTVSADECNGYSGTINLTASSLPTGATASFSPTSISGSGTSTLTFTPSSSTPIAVYNLDVTGTDSGGSPIEANTEAIANVVANDFTTSISPSSASISKGSKSSVTVTFTSVSSYSGTIYPYDAGAPGSSTVTWKPYPVTVRSGSHGSTTWTISTTSSTPVGTYEIQMRGIDLNGLDHAAVFTLTVH